MAKEDNIEVMGKVTEVFPGGKFQVEWEEDEDNTMTVAHLSGKMRQKKIKVVLGDRVLIEVSPYDLTRGRITRRK